jgi:hypothetical protein
MVDAGVGRAASRRSARSRSISCSAGSAPATGVAPDAASHTIRLRGMPNRTGARKSRTCSDMSSGGPWRKCTSRGRKRPACTCTPTPRAAITDISQSWRRGGAVGSTYDQASSSLVRERSS